MNNTTLSRFNNFTITANFLHQELDAWAAVGEKVKIWWRDDDAAKDTLQLRQLINLAEEIRTIVAIAVIPNCADESLLSILSKDRCCIWQHGWDHSFHQSGEFGGSRTLEAMSRDAMTGSRAMDDLFGPNGWQKIFVPPNHMLSMEFKTLLPELGYLGLSAGIPLTPHVAGVTEVNAEIDVMNWPAGEMLDSLIIAEMIVDQLRARRLGTVPSGNPLGILTHHLVLKDSDWDLLAAIFQLLLSHPGAEIIPADTLFASRRKSSPASMSF